ncbi:MAG TPA: carboxypeptidase-like regulatory domain-containing protein, partial [Gemmatimonadales bacterium]|nr:carboxypeptidase-like regulatory domain-containing protein [Gemmatimonadales bacterium]
MTFFRSIGFGLVMAAAISAPLAAQESRLSGRVTEAGSDQGIPGARVVLGATSRIETTGQDGSFLFRGAPPGEHQVRVVAIGYAAQVKPVAVTAGEAATVDFALSPVPVQLDEIVTTATGQQSRLEIGNSIATIEASKVAEEAPITEFGNLLTG